MPTTVDGNERLVTISFPAAGIDLSAAFCKQPNRPINAQGKYARTTVQAVNVVGYESQTERCRGGSRPGLSKYIPVPIVAGWIVQGLFTITIVSDSARN